MRLALAAFFLLELSEAQRRGHPRRAAADD
jgi:hypothetical protein